LVDFVEEVEERLRAERYRALAGRYLPWIIAAVVALIIGWLGIWGYDAWRDRNIGQASITYDKGMAALAGGDPTGAYNTLAPVAKDGPAGYRTLALMQQANIRLGAGKPDEAAALYDAAAKAAPNPIFGDLARLRAAQTLMDTAPYAQLETRLKPLAGDNRPFSLQARELLAMAKLQAGKTQEARGDLNALSLTLGVTPAMRTRAQGAIALIDSGQAALLGQVVRTAATLPPSAGAMSAAPAGAPTSGAPPAQASDETPPENASGNPQ
jgi:hypothetical protein